MFLQSDRVIKISLNWIKAFGGGIVTVILSSSGESKMINYTDWKGTNQKASDYF